MKVKSISKLWGVESGGGGGGGGAEAEGESVGALPVWSDQIWIAIKSERTDICGDKRLICESGRGESSGRATHGKPGWCTLRFSALTKPWRTTLNNMKLSETLLQVWWDLYINLYKRFRQNIYTNVSKTPATPPAASTPPPCHSPSPLSPRLLLKQCRAINDSVKLN